MILTQRHYTIHCNGYFDKDDHELIYESSIRHLTNGERLPLWNHDGSLLNPNEYYATNFRYDLDKRTKDVVTKKFICEAPVGSGKSTAIRKWISHHEWKWFMVIVPTVNIAEEFYVKLSDMLNYDVEPKKKHIRLCVNDNAFSDFTKAVYDNVNVIITTYNAAAKCLGDIVEEFYEREMRLDYFLVIDEAHMLLNYIGLIEITKEFDKVALLSATADDIKQFACFRDYIIVNPRITEKYHRNIYLNKLIPDADQQRAAIISLIDQKRMKYDEILVKIEDKKECKLLKESLKNRYKVALYTSEDKETKLNENGMFETDVDVIISTYSIQNGQSNKENVLSIFVQTYIDTTSSIRQFINRLLRRNSNTWLFDTRELNEEIPCKERHFVKRKGMLKFETTSPPNRVRKNYQEEPPSDQQKNSYSKVKEIPSLRLFSQVR